MMMYVIENKYNITILLYHLLLLVQKNFNLLLLQENWSIWYNNYILLLQHPWNSLQWNMDMPTKNYMYM